MISFQTSGIEADIKQLTSSYHKTESAIAADLLKQVKIETPVNTGRARKGWTKETNNKGFVIQNTVPYVEYLEKPYVKSKKAPEGMIGPALNSIKGKYK